MRWWRYLVAIGLFAIAALVGGTANAATTPGLLYAGDTSQGQAMTMTVTSARTSIKRLRLVVSGSCKLAPGAPPDTETMYTTGWVFGGVRLNGTMPWRVTESINETLPGGVRSKGLAVYTGRRSGDRMIGTITIAVRETTASGSVIRTCRTGAINFRLSNQSVYGGLTSQRSIAYIALNLRRTKVVTVRWDWFGTCTLGPAAKPDTPTELAHNDVIDGPVSIGPGGRFTVQTETDPVAFPELGITVVFSNSVSGRRLGNRLTGTLTGSVVEADIATGAVIRSCVSKVVSFNLVD